MIFFQFSFHCDENAKTLIEVNPECGAGPKTCPACPVATCPTTTTAVNATTTTDPTTASTTTTTTTTTTTEYIIPGTLDVCI